MTTSVRETLIDTLWDAFNWEDENFSYADDIDWDIQTKNYNRYVDSMREIYWNTYCSILEAYKINKQLTDEEYEEWKTRGEISKKTGYACTA